MSTTVSCLNPRLNFLFQLVFRFQPSRLQLLHIRSIDIRLAVSILKKVTSVDIQAALKNCDQEGGRHLRPLIGMKR